MCATVSAASIAVNFAQNTNQPFTQGVNIGPTSINSANWNNTIDRDTGTFATAGFNTGSLVDDSGATLLNTTLDWASGGTYFNNAGVGSDSAKLIAGYLDDTGSANFTLANHGYALYDVYIIASADAGNGDSGTATFTHTGSSVNGTSSGTYTALGPNGGTLIEATGGTAGNYIKFTNQTAANLTIAAGARNGSVRGPINGFVIVQIPEPSTTALFGLGGLALILRRRK